VWVGRRWWVLRSEVHVSGFAAIRSLSQMLSSDIEVLKWQKRE